MIKGHSSQYEVLLTNYMDSYQGSKIRLIMHPVFRTEELKQVLPIKLQLFSLIIGHRSRHL
uniref:Uncharacterized protein n=1 Tax=Arundo donax TaxID=35708 RepID=A0A0A8ZW67_ARUDO